MMINTLPRAEVRDLISQFTKSEKLRSQLYDRLVCGKTYVEMGLAGDKLHAKRQEREYVEFRRKCESFFLFAEKAVSGR